MSDQDRQDEIGRIVVDSAFQVHKAQILSYMKLSNKKLGYLINFNTKLIKNGIQRYAL